MISIFKKKAHGQELSLKIKGMHCTSCAMNIDGALEDTDGVMSSDTSYAKAEVKVLFDPQKVNQEIISKVIETEGYEVVTD